MAEYIFNLSISAEEYLRLYQGSVKDVVARAHNGQRVRFAAGYLRPYVMHDGVNGVFRILTDSNNKFIKIEQIG